MGVCTAAPVVGVVAPLGLVSPVKFGGPAPPSFRSGASLLVCPKSPSLGFAWDAAGFGVIEAEGLVKVDSAGSGEGKGGIIAVWKI